MTAAERTPKSRSSADSDDSLRVLVVEDELPVRRLIARRLQQAGLVVVAAASGEEALELCHASEEPIHLLVTDGIMPGMDGFELARRLAQRRPPVPAILISGFLGHFVTRTDVPENIEAFFPKPFSGEELVAKILEVLGATA